MTCRNCTDPKDIVRVLRSIEKELHPKRTNLISTLPFHVWRENMNLRATESNILAASQIVKRGGLVVYPTDTVYGLGCDPFNIQAVKRIFKAKGERKKPLPVLASNVESVEKIAHLPKMARRIAARFWPGPLTFVLPKKRALPNAVTCNLDSVGVRIPRHKTAFHLVQLSDGLLIGTSANKTGKNPPRTAQEADKQLGKEVDIILDGGPTPLGVASTVIDLTSEKPRILREGPVSLDDIMKVL